MKKGNIRDLHHGREVWKHLERIVYSHSPERVFEDWLDLMLSAYLSLTDNLGRPDFWEKLKSNKLDGPYESRYMEIVRRYGDDAAKRGDRPIDHFVAASTELVKETARTEADVLGEIYMAMITFGQHGQFFTPQHISSMMAEMMGVKDREKVHDPTCGSGTMLIEAGKRNPNALMEGYDLDGRCAKMAALNMYLFDLNAIIRCGDTLKYEFHTEWRTHKGGFIWETDLTKDRLPKTSVGQQELFAA